jgi:hypothetical protein
MVTPEPDALSSDNLAGPGQLKITPFFGEKDRPKVPAGIFLFL